MELRHLRTRARPAHHAFGIDKRAGCFCCTRLEDNRENEGGETEDLVARIGHGEPGRNAVCDTSKVQNSSVPMRVVVAVLKGELRTYLARAKVNGCHGTQYSLIISLLGRRLLIIRSSPPFSILDGWCVARVL